MGLRVAVLSRNFATTGGGAERYSIAVVEQLAARHEVHVFAQNIAHVFPGVTYHPVATPMGRPRWINQLYFAWATWRATRKGYDIVHSHENTWHGNVQTVHVLPIKHTLFVGKQGVGLALRWLKVLTSPRLLAYLWLERTRYAFALRKRVVCASASLKAVLLAVYPAAEPMLEVVTPGVQDVPSLLPVETKAAAKAAARLLLELPQAVPLLLFVGNDFVKKGLPTLLEALAQLDSTTQLVVVGKAESQVQMQRIAQRLGLNLGLTSRVHFLGSLADMGPAYRAADMLVHPTLEDSYGMVVLEAMAHGLPVVVSSAQYCGIASDLTHGSNAMLLDDPTQVGPLVSAIRQVQDNAVLAAALINAALAFASQHSWQQVATFYEGMFADIAKTYSQRWLVLSHAFNMDGRAASQTITDKLPHLEAAGIELVVLSGVSGRKDARYEHYQLWPAGPAGIRFEMRHVLRKHLSSAWKYRTAMVLLSLPLMPFMLIEKLLRPVESSWSWWLSAYVKGRWLARQKSFDLIYSTGGAFAAHVAARQLKKALHVPWMAEVHDPLVKPGRTADQAISSQQRMQAEVERCICADADIAIWFTDAALASARRRHPMLGDRGRMLLPGVDCPFEVLPPYVRGPKFVIGHFGSLSDTRNLTPILQALEILCAEDAALHSLVELHVYGGPLDSVSRSALATSPVRGCVHHFGRIETDPISGMSGREQILRRMRAVDVLLLLHGEEAMCAEYIPSKLYEYLWMQRPILATVCGNPQMAELLGTQGHIVVPQAVTDFPAANALAHELAHLLGQWRTLGVADNHRFTPYTTQAAVANLIAWAKTFPVQSP